MQHRGSGEIHPICHVPASVGGTCCIVVVSRTRLSISTHSVDKKHLTKSHRRHCCCCCCTFSPSCNLHLLAPSVRNTAFTRPHARRPQARIPSPPRRIAMAKPASIKISAPFDARHVGGVNIPGTTLPAGISRASSTLEPDTTPSHTFAAHGTTEIPRRSNTIATSLGRPSLKLKTSLSLLRGRSASHSPDSRTREHAREMNPLPSLRKTPSTSKFWHRTPPPAISPPNPAPSTHLPASSPTPSPPPMGPTSLATTSPPPLPPRPTENPYTYPLLPPRAAPTHPPAVPPKPAPPAVRPKRADSGTAIDFAGVPPIERPLGFREILARPSFEERMALYTRTREYWARADHGLGEWVGRVGGR